MSHTSGSVIVAGARTPIGRLLGGLKDLSAADLGGVAIKAALEKLIAYAAYLKILGSYPVAVY